ncbi:Peroxisomal biogenesis factor 2 [Bienertia sinuspersici]
MINMLTRPIIFNLLFVPLITLSNPISITKSMAEAAPGSSSTPDVYIVYTEQPTDGIDHESFHLRTLSSVLGRIPGSRYESTICAQDRPYPNPVQSRSSSAWSRLKSVKVVATFTYLLLQKPHEV